MKVKAAFIFVAPETDYTIHRAVIETPALTFVLKVFALAFFSYLFI